MEILEEKGEVSEALRQKILSEKEMDVLSRWIKIALTMTVSEFEEKM